MEVKLKKSEVFRLNLIELFLPRNTQLYMLLAKKGRSYKPSPKNPVPTLHKSQALKNNSALFPAFILPNHTQYKKLNFLAAVSNKKCSVFISGLIHHCESRFPQNIHRRIVSINHDNQSSMRA